MQILGPQPGRGLGHGQCGGGETGRGSLPDHSRICADRTGRRGFRPERLNIVTGYGAEAGAALSGHPDVQSYFLHRLCADGRNGAGGGRQETPFPVTLELGGKSAQVVFADADLDRAIPFLVNAGIQNAGQTCSASSRILVQRSVYEDVRGAHGRKISRAEGRTGRGGLAGRPPWSRSARRRSWKVFSERCRQGTA
jgi:aldehyde dehydrogenase (NAD+)